MSTNEHSSAPPVTGDQVWQAITGGYKLDDVEKVTLHRLCRHMDIANKIDEDLSEMGVTTAGSKAQPRVNPLLVEMREQAKTIDLVQMALALPLPGEAHGRRRTGQAKAAAKAGRPPKTNVNKVAHLRQGGA